MGDVHVDMCVCVMLLLILWVSMMCSDSLFQNSIAEEAQAISHNHISHTWLLEKNTRTQIWISSHCSCSYPDSGVGLTSHTHTSTHNLPSNGTRDASIVCPTFSHSLSVSNPCLSSWQVPAAGELGCRLMIGVGRMDTQTGTNLRTSESLFVCWGGKFSNHNFSTKFI